jgi:ribosomal protein L14E/L6E/L27E
MELEKAELKAELDKKKIEIELEKEELKAELDKKNKELELEKTNKQIQDNNEISSLKQRDLEYEEASTIEDFFQSIE